METTKTDRIVVNETLAYDIIGFTTEMAEENQPVISLICRVYKDGEFDGTLHAAIGLTEIHPESPMNNDWKEKITNHIIGGFEKALAGVAAQIEKHAEEKRIENVKSDSKDYFGNLKGNLAAKDAIAIVVAEDVTRDEVENALIHLTTHPSFSGTQDTVLLHINRNEVVQDILNLNFPKQANVLNIIREWGEEGNMCEPCVMLAGLSIMQTNDTKVVFLIGNPNDKGVQTALDRASEMEVDRVFLSTAP